MLDPCELSDPGRPILWDLDGTIVDTRRDIASGVAGLFRERGLTPLSRDEVIRHVGRGVRVLVARCLEVAGHPAADERDLDDAVERFREHYARHLMDTTVPYEALPELLLSLAERGRKMAVVSNKPEDFTRAILHEIGLLACFGAVLGGDSLPVRKPSPKPLLHALRLCSPGTLPSQAVLIGDSVTDVQTARAAGMPVCAVAWGFDPEGLLKDSDPDWRVETPQELHRLLLGTEDEGAGAARE
jgi:phosphoglycolate phosphatase